MGRYMTKEQMEREFNREEAKFKPSDKGGKAAYKSVTAAVHAAEAARDEARQYRGDALRAVERAEKMEKEAKDACVDALTEGRVVCGKAVGLCVACMLVSVLPWVVWLLRGVLW